MRSFILYLVSTSFLAVPALVAQQFEIGAFLAGGRQSAPQPVADSTSSGVLLAGTYAEWVRPHIHPGLEVRYVSAGGGGVDGPSAIGVTGALAGPRASITLGRIHLYVAALAGPNHADQAGSNQLVLPGQLPVNENRDGFTAQGTVGVDIDWHPHWRVRVIEFSQTRFTGLPDSRPFELTFGIVLHTR